MQKETAVHCQTQQYIVYAAHHSQNLVILLAFAFGRAQSAQLYILHCVHWIIIVSFSVVAVTCHATLGHCLIVDLRKQAVLQTRTHDNQSRLHMAILVCAAVGS